MQYKTIVLNLLQERKELHEQLRLTRSLLSTINRCANELKTSHQAWMEKLALTSPGSNPLQTSSEAMELAIQELEGRLPLVSPEDNEETLSLDQAMAFLGSHTPKE